LLFPQNEKEGRKIGKGGTDSPVVAFSVEKRRDQQTIPVEKGYPTNTRINKQAEACRICPGIYLLRSPEEVYSEIRQIYDTSDISTTDLRQNEKYNIAISNYITTDTTDSVLKKVLEEICRMYAFISSCESERDITYERYLEKPVVSVVSVVEGSSITVSAPTTCRKPVVEPVV
jgi:hypothetical protein